MGWGDKLWEKSVFSRLVISFICVILPIYILSIIIYNWGINTVRDKISNTIITQASYYMEELSKEIERIQKFQYNFMYDMNLKRLASIPNAMKDIELAEALINLQRNIYTIKNSSTYIDDVTVDIPAIKKTVTASGSRRLDYHSYSINSKFKQTSSIVVDDSGIYIFTISPQSYINIDNHVFPRYIITIKLMEDKIKRDLESMISIGEETIIFYRPVDQIRISVNDSYIFDQVLKNRLIEIGSKFENISETVNINGTKYLSIYSFASVLDAVLCIYIPENTVFESLIKFKVWFVILTLVAFIIIVGYSFYLHKYINEPLSILVSSFKKIEEGDLGSRIDNKRDNEFGYIYKQFNVMVDKLNNLIDQVYKQKILMQRSEMKQLQSQINPHFLYNSIFTLRTMAQMGDYDNLVEFAEQLGQYYQYITRDRKDEITLDKEVNHARIYTNIQARRFSRRIRVKFDDLPEKFAKLVVPRLILQPIIENAFEHGLARKEKDGLLRVKFIDTTNSLNIVVEDNGDDLSDSVLNNLNMLIASNNNDIEVTGLLNVYRRLKLLFGSRCNMTFERGELGGLKVTIEIS